jgi:hypothetical protein
MTLLRPRKHGSCRCPEAGSAPTRDAPDSTLVRFFRVSRAFDWGGAHTHPTDTTITEKYDPATGGGSIVRDIEHAIDDWKATGMPHFVRLAQGEWIMISPKDRMIYQIRPPNKPGADAVFPMPRPINAQYFTK